MFRGRSPGQQTASKDSKSSRAELELVTCTCRQVKFLVCRAATRVGLSNCFLPSLHGTGSSCATSYFWLLLISCLMSSLSPSHILTLFAACHVFAYICANTRTSVLKKTIFPILSLEKAVSISPQKTILFRREKSSSKIPKFHKRGPLQVGSLSSVENFSIA